MIECPSCKAKLPQESFNTGFFAPCPGCQSPIRALVFSSFIEDPKVGLAAQPVLIAESTNCFFHGDKKAVVPCFNCGRFLCSLCDIEFDGQHLCPGCLEAGSKKKKIRTVSGDVTCYDKITFAVAFYPTLTIVFTLFSAPIAVFMAIKYWNRPSLSGSKIRMASALILAVIQIVIWAIIFIGIFTRHG